MRQLPCLESRQLIAVMLNDLLLRDFFLMLAAWNRGTLQENGPLRIMIPTNMRVREDARMPAANVFSYAFVTLYASACRNRRQLLKTISADMAMIKRPNSASITKRACGCSADFPRFALVPKSKMGIRDRGFYKSRICVRSSPFTI